MRIFASLSLAGLMAASLTANSQTPAASQVALTPPMGWNSCIKFF
jgi:hypothetical protein